LVAVWCHIYDMYRQKGLYVHISSIQSPAVPLSSTCTTSESLTHEPSSDFLYLYASYLYYYHSGRAPMPQNKLLQNPLLSAKETPTSLYTVVSYCTLRKIVKINYSTSRIIMTPLRGSKKGYTSRIVLSKKTCLVRKKQS